MRYFLRLLLLSSLPLIAYAQEPKPNALTKLEDQAWEAAKPWLVPVACIIILSLLVIRWWHSRDN